MYALVYMGRVAITFDKWYLGRINSELRDLDVNSQVVMSDQERVPFSVDLHSRIVPLIEIREDYNPRIQYHDGPLWDIQDDKVVATYYPMPLDIDIAKDNLMREVAAQRYFMENVELNISLPFSSPSYVPDSLSVGADFLPAGRSIRILTDKATRSLLASKLPSLGDQFINWKFGDGWVSLNRSDIGYILSRIDKSVQAAFDWELAKVNEIEACSSLDDINAVIVIPQEV